MNNGNSYEDNRPLYKTLENKSRISYFICKTYFLLIPLSFSFEDNPITDKNIHPNKIMIAEINSLRIQQDRYTMSSHQSAILKARKILNSYQQIQPRRYCVEPHQRSKQKENRRSSISSASKSRTNLKKDFSFCNSQNKSTSTLNHSSQKPTKRINSSFTSLYGRQTRYDKIMKLKVKPSFKHAKKEDKSKKSVLQNSFSSCNSSKDQSKENRIRNKSRLDKIMNIKVTKPKVASTLIHYQPKQGVRPLPKEKTENAIKQWKQCEKKIKKSVDQEQKQDRLWKVFERQRQIRCKLKKNTHEREQKEQRRRQQRFQNLVSKQVIRIERERQVSKRKSEVFANYVYPYF